MPLKPPLTDIQKALLFIVDGPAFEDCCDHLPDEYQFTIEWCGKMLDVYVYDYCCDTHPGIGGPLGKQGICLRNSSNPGGYCSGPVDMWLTSLSHLDGVQREAIVALLSTNHVRLSPREKANV